MYCYKHSCSNPFTSIHARSQNFYSETLSIPRAAISKEGPFGWPSPPSTRRKLTSAFFFLPTDTTHHFHHVSTPFKYHRMNEPSLDGSHSDLDEDVVSKLTLRNTIENARQHSHSIRTLACNAESYVSPGSTHAPAEGRTRRDDSEVDQLVSISLDTTDADDSVGKRDSKIKFSCRTKEHDQLLTKLEWRKLNKETAEKERDERWRKLDPTTPDPPEAEKLESAWWDQWKKMRAEERRAMLGAPGSPESSQEPEKLSESDKMQTSERIKSSDASDTARRTLASSIELPLRHREKPVEPSKGYSGGGSQISEKCAARTADRKRGGVKRQFHVVS